MFRFGLEGGMVFGEDPGMIGDETSGKEKESKEGVLSQESTLGCNRAKP
jgi:hypothetical protein